MSGVKVERVKDKMCVFFKASEFGVTAYVYQGGSTSFYAPDLMSVTMESARRLAAAIIAVADAVEKEGGKP